MNPGALNTQTRRYITPDRANKHDDYTCPDCDKSLTFCSGKVKKPYFRHSVVAANPCTYYEHPSESQIHKDAKYRLKARLEINSPLQCTRKCYECAKDNLIILNAESKTVTVEHRFQHNSSLQIADVAIVNPDGTINSILEVLHTHKTLIRPEPWFELRANDIIKSPIDFSDIQCHRKEKCKDCLEKEKNLQEQLCKKLDEMPLPRLLKHKDFDWYVRYKLGQRDFVNRDIKVIDKNGKTHIDHWRHDHMRFDFHELDGEYNDEIIGRFHQWFLKGKKVYICSYKGQLIANIVNMDNQVRPKMYDLQGKVDNKSTIDYTGDGTVNIIKDLLSRI